MMQKNSFSQQRFRTYTRLEGEIFWNSEITMAGSQCHKPGQRVQRHPFLACKHRRISERNDHRKYVCVRRLLFPLSKPSLIALRAVLGADH